jgi:D-cysteine desulfhydrase family pyridoxal phosphate-dependent enzyme
MHDISQLISRFPRAELISQPTPVERLDRMSDKLGIDLWMKRDDLTGLSFGGNKTRQMEYYIGAAVAKKADIILITGAVQSNFVRTAAAAAAKYGMKAILQLEERVPNKGAAYYSSGNVLLSKLLNVEHMSFPEGENEAGADAALAERAAELQAEGQVPFIIGLGIDHPPLGSIGYVRGGAELAGQMTDFDVAVVPSGSGATHGGWLTGLRLSGIRSPVYGICVRRDAVKQKARIETLTIKLSEILGIDRPFSQEDILTWDGALAPGYGQIGPKGIGALKLMAQTEGIMLDPVYTSKTFAGLLGLLEEGTISRGQKVLMLHTGGLPAIFGYQEELQ